jgi:hypothetical protein
MPRPKAQILSKVCERCSAPFTVPDKVNYREKRYCTRACSNGATAEQRASTLRGKAEYQPPICPCGNEVTATRKYVYAKDKKYCSDECRKKYGLKRRADPTNWMTKTCRNCGEVFTIRKSSQSYGYYCSNACARRHTKTKQHIVVEDAIVLDSGYEALFWGLCMLHKIPIERYDRAKGVAWKSSVYDASFQDSDGWYAPDFYLPMLDMAVELKGLEDPEDAVKWAVFQAARGTSLAVLDGCSLRQKLGAMITRDGLLTVLHDLISTQETP